jgi:hypothetical protein
LNTPSTELPTSQPGIQEHNLFSVMGQKLAGHAMALIIAATESSAKYYALHELGFLVVSETFLVSESVYIARIDTMKWLSTMEDMRVDRGSGIVQKPLEK